MNTAEYLIVQHISDLFRRETRNVGVIVRIKGETNGRFYGEIEPGKIDGRQTRDLPYPGIYAQWVRYWHRTLSTKNGSAWDEILNSATGNYQVLNGGSVDRIGEDSINEVTKFLYDALVSEGGMASAIVAPGEDEAVAGKIPPPQPRVTFKFEERSLLPMSELANRGNGFTEIIVRDPATGEERKMVIPNLYETRCPHCGEKIK